jgi:putative ABC transport system substrate-binding protein
VRRREFITGFGSIAAAWPLAGLAQPADRMRRVGILLPWPEYRPDVREFSADFPQDLGRFGWLDGENIRIDWRFAAGNPTLFKPFAAELVDLAPDVILAMTPLAVTAVLEQTHTIPVVFAFVLDPVALGFVQSLARPGGNITGFATFDAPIMGKWVQFLKEIAPRVTRVAVIFNPDTAPYAPLLSRAIEVGARSSGMTVMLAPVRDDAEIAEAIAAHAREPWGGLMSLPDPFTASHRDAIAATALRHRLPLIGVGEELAKAGGLIVYEQDFRELPAQLASYIDRILRGATPADLPVQYPTKYSLMINLKTAKALDLNVPPSMLDLADKVIE